MRAQHEIALRAREKGRALARIAVAANESGSPGYRELFEAFAARSSHRDEVRRLLAGSPAPDLHHPAR